MSEPSKTRPVRWRLAAAILVLGAAGMIGAQFRDTSKQYQNLGSLAVFLFTTVLLFLWAIFFSRLPGRMRLGIFLLGAVFVGFCATSVRMTGVTGDLVPILSFRWEKKIGAAVPQSVSATNRAAPSASFPQFLGPNRNGIIPEIRLEANWTAHPPQLLWKIALGEAWTGFVVANGLALTQEQRGQSELVTCYDLLTGRLVWAHSNEARYFTTLGGEGPRASPTIHSNRVFALGATGILNCIDLTSGKIVWTKDLVKEHGGRVPEWGFAGSPLIHNDVAIVNAGGGKGRSLVAHKIDTGDFAWGGGDDSAGYSSPTIHNLAGAHQIITFTGRNVSSHNVTNGSVLWQHPWPATHPHITVPVAISTNQLLASSGYGYGSELLEIHRQTNSWKAERIWKSNRLKSKFASLIPHNGFVYGLDDGILVCLYLSNGERRWQGERYGHGQLLLVGEVILMTTEKGEVLLVEPSPESEKVIARFPTLKGKMWNPPALAGEYLLVRNNHEAACYQVKLQAR